MPTLDGSLRGVEPIKAAAAVEITQPAAAAPALTPEQQARKQLLIDKYSTPTAKEPEQAQELTPEQQARKEKLAPIFAARREEIKSETGFLRNFENSIAAPMQAVFQGLEKLGAPVEFDEQAALMARAKADLAAESNPYIATAGNIAGVLATALVLPVGGLTAGAGRLGTAAILGAEGAAYGALQPQLEGYEDTRARDALLGLGLGAGVGVAIGRGIARSSEEIGNSLEILSRNNPTTGKLEVVVQGDAALPVTLQNMIDDGAAVIVDALPPIKGQKMGRKVQGRNIEQAKPEDIIVTQVGVEPAAPKPVTKVGKALQAVGEALDPIVGMMSTRIGNISRPILKRVRQFEFDAKKKTSEYYKTSEPFIRRLDKMDDTDKGLVDRALSNGDFDVVEQTLKKYGDEAVGEFNQVRVLLKNVYKELKKSGFKTAEIPNYFPRLVKDVDGLRSSFGLKEQTAIDRALKAYAKENKINTVDIPKDTVNNIIDQTIRGLPKTIKKSKRLEASRTVGRIDDSTADFYASSTDSLEAYLRTASHNIAKAKFFGKYVGDDTKDAIQEIVGKAKDAGKLSVKQEGDLVSMLQARFIQGELAPNKFIKGVRDMGYATTIANPFSALIQLSDLGQTMMLAGVRNTLRSLFGKKNFNIDDVGLRDTILEEFESGSKALDKLFRLSGFKRMDKLTKETFINAAYKRDAAMVRSDKGAAAFSKKYGDLYGDETAQLIADLRNGKPSELVKFHLFNELSGVQPISLLEVPEAYAKSPNGRIFYMLKSFTLKQYDLLRREVVQEYKAGNKAGAVKSAIRYMGFVSAMGGTMQTIRDVGTGRSGPEEAIEKLPDRMLFESLSALGFGTYVTERYLRQGKVVDFAVNQMVPAAPLVNAATTEFADLFSKSAEAEIEPILRSTPVVGTAIPLLAMWANFFGGGFESYLAEQDAKNE